MKLPWVVLSATDMLYLVNQLPALYRLGFSYYAHGSPRWELDQLSGEQVASTRDALRLVNTYCLQEVVVWRLVDNVHEYFAVLRANCSLILAGSRLRSLVKITNVQNYAQRYPGVVQDIGGFFRYPMFDMPHICDIEVINDTP
ncbi:hypothetical protein DL89DRAFT_253689 [Linderina pennispora]|uniref:Uncharacterized protein n=1 Tax=Linderina pennispora TaxID=61395 RepID=A0A1Y1WJU1_9FUNG|nr:uncharacterized protein DL89DRAFT_253689 [Linderina pennispora]ORX73753.1 hypothetical protein DL89DRAFT_253689 [Linderina pennispora]